VLFRDPEFSLVQRHVAEICEGIAGAGLSLAWRCETRIDTLKPSLLELMARAGCRGLNFAIETANDAANRAVGRKPIAQELARETVAACRRLGIETFCFFIVGLPGDTAEDVRRSIAFACELLPDRVQFLPITPYLGTQVHRWAQERGFLEFGEAHELSTALPTMRSDHLDRAAIAALCEEGYRRVEEARAARRPWARIRRFVPAPARRLLRKLLG